MAVERFIDVEDEKNGDKYMILIHVAGIVLMISHNYMSHPLKSLLDKEEHQ